jgi:hypothetical protein
MLRLVLLLLYLFSSSSTVPHAKQGGSLDPLGLTPAQGSMPPASNPSLPFHNTDQGGSADPLGLTLPPHTQTDQGGGIDPLG